MKLEWHPMFASNPLDRIRFGMSLLHAFMRSFGWLLKGFCYQDVRKYEANEEEKVLSVYPYDEVLAVCLFEFSRQNVRFQSSNFAFQLCF